MKKKLLPLTVLFYGLSLAQVGINTTSPTQELDVNGNVRFRNVPENAILDNTDRVLLLQGDGTAKKVTVSSLQPPGKFALDDIYTVTATVPVDKNIAGTYSSSNFKIDNVDIQMNQSIIIPAKTDALVIVNYSVPMGMGSNFTCANYLWYYGIRFLKDGVEMPQGSRKFTFFRTDQSAKVSTISGSYSEKITNNTLTDLTVTYSLNGYLEFDSGTIANPCIIRFNMNSATGENYNWGRANMNIQMFKKPL
ncbi:hypothetical protein [Chryseobacterium sp. HR92]|uniref:hypothetical protein n=1 Tax=Chryseobacterium sp. HR92 TaxID=3094839 RepID=UPI00388FA7B9|nr:hypothetical protein SFA27_13625 [Chryseobacterium sp. HR92]